MMQYIQYLPYKQGCLNLESSICIIQMEDTSPSAKKLSTPQTQHSKMRCRAGPVSGGSDGVLNV